MNESLLSKGRRAPNEIGFVIQITVVLLIIGSLLAFAVPAYINFRKHAENCGASVAGLVAQTTSTCQS